MVEIDEIMKAQQRLVEAMQRQEDRFFFELMRKIMPPGTLHPGIAKDFALEIISGVPDVKRVIYKGRCIGSVNRTIDLEKGVFTLEFIPSPKLY